MPTATVNATLQGRVFYSLSAGLINWTAQVRDASTGSVANTYTTNSTVGGAIRTYLITSRSGVQGFCGRVFLFFDNLDAATAGNTITAATLKVYNSSSANTINTIAVEASAWGGNGTTTTLSTSDYSNLDQSIPYSPEDLSWGGGTYNDFVLNTTAIAAMNADGYLNVAVIEGEHDYGNTNPTLNDLSESASVRFNDPTNPIKLELTYTTGYGNSVINIPKASIDSIINVSSANIDTVINV
jgi:hypothetical protein